MKKLFAILLLFSALFTQAPYSASAPPAIATIAALKALPPGAYPTVQLLGYTAAGDGGGGILNWISTASPGSADPCIAYRPNSNPAVGLWVRPLSPFLLARQCGIATYDDTIAGNVTFTDLAGAGTRMVVADAAGELSTQAIPSGGSLANPTGTIGLTAVNGALTTGLRSDGAPALSQAIAPTWTALHNFAEAIAFTSNGTTGQGRIYKNATSGLSLRGVVGSSYDFALFGGASGSYIFRNPTGGTAIEFPGSGISVAGTSLLTGTITGTTLAGSGTRMVVADATGIMSTQSIPAGASLANPTGTIGLTAVNGSLTSGLRSDGAPALSQAIVPSWSGIHTFTATGAGSASGAIHAAASPSIAINETDGAADNKWWDISASAEQLRFRVVNDANSSSSNFLTIDRTGTTVDAVTFPTAVTGAGFKSSVVAALTRTVNNDSLRISGSMKADSGVNMIFMGRDHPSDFNEFYIRRDNTPLLSYDPNSAWVFHVTVSFNSINTIGITNTGGINMANNVGLSQYDFGGVNRGLLNLRSDNVVQVGGGQSGGIEFNAGSGPDVIATISATGDFYASGKILHNATEKVTSTFGTTTGTISVDASLSDFYKVTLTGNATLANPTNSGSTYVRHFTVRVKQDGTGSRTLGFGTNYRFPGGIVPTLTTTANAVDYLSFILDEDADLWDFVGNAFNLLPAGT